MVDFTTMAAVKDEDLPVARKLPQGTYIWAVDRLPSQEPSRASTGKNIKFRLKCVGAIEDFEDPEALEEYGNVVGTIRTKSFFFPEDAGGWPDMDEDAFADWQARAIAEINKFLAVDLQVEGEGPMERLSSCLSHQCLIQVVHKADQKDPKAPTREELGRSAPLVVDD